MKSDIENIKYLIHTKKLTELTAKVADAAYRESRDPNLNNALGVAAIAINEIEKARAFFFKAALLQPSQPKYLKNLVKLLTSARLFIDHKEAFSSALDLSSDIDFGRDLFFTVFRYGMAVEACSIGEALLDSLGGEELFVLALVEVADSIGRYQLSKSALRNISLDSITDWSLKRLKLEHDESVSAADIDHLLSKPINEHQAAIKEFLKAEKLWAMDEAVAAVSNYICANEFVRKNTRSIFEIDLQVLSFLQNSRQGTPPLEKIETFTPVFIIGMPRCGSSLLHQLLVSHSQIAGVGELGVLGPSIGKWLLEGDQSYSSLKKVRSSYIEAVESFINKTGQNKSNYVVDKSLYSYRYLGYIKDIFPSAKFICLERNRVEHKFSIYRKHFLAGHHQYAYCPKALDCAFEIYDCYTDLWKKTTGEILTISHKNLLQNTNKTTSDILDFLAIDDNEKLDNRYAKVPIATASAQTSFKAISYEAKTEQLKIALQKNRLNFTNKPTDTKAILRLLKEDTTKPCDLEKILKKIGGTSLSSEILLYLAQNSEKNVDIYLKSLPTNPAEYYNEFQINKALMTFINTDFFHKAIHLGEQYKSIGKFDKAIYNNLALALCRSGHYKECVSITEVILKNDPKNDIARINRINAYIGNEQYDDIRSEAIHFQESNPHNPIANINIARIEQQLGNWKTALKFFMLAHDLDKHSHQPLAGLSTIFAENGEFDKSIKYIDDAIRIAPENYSLIKNKIFRLNYVPNQDPDAKKLTLQSYCEKYNKLKKMILPSSSSIVPKMKLKIGFVSGDYRRHSTRFFIFPLVEGLASLGHDIVLYSNTRVGDEITEEYQKITGILWADITKQSDEEVSHLIRKHKIDVLFDLSGHTAGDRLGVFAKAPAPLSVTAIGFNSSTGLNSVNNFLTDPIIVPKNSNQYFSEEVIRTKSFVHAFRPDKAALDTNQFEAPITDKFVFNSNSRAIRINSDVIQMWSDILDALPEAELHINGQINDGSEAKEMLFERFDKFGSITSQIRIFKQSPIYSALSGVHLTLDTMPHNSGTTLFESLYSGVPFLTIQGNESVGRLGSSILHHVGLSEFIARTKDEYVQKAIYFCKNWEPYSDKSKIHEKFMKSSVMDEKQNSREISELLIEKFNSVST